MSNQLITEFESVREAYAEAFAVRERALRSAGPNCYVESEEAAKKLRKLLNITLRERKRIVERDGLEERVKFRCIVVSYEYDELTKFIKELRGVLRCGRASINGKFRLDDVELPRFLTEDGPARS
ncbi:MAG: hypothetical protein M3Q08_03965 [Pseudomonadota bacterium]|nr:hypothetical protein [Pseudomonadota bacterium]